MSKKEKNINQSIRACDINKCHLNELIPTLISEIGTNWTAMAEWQAVVDIAYRDSNKTQTYSGDEQFRESVEMRLGSFIDLYEAISEGSQHWASHMPELHFYLCQCPIISKEDGMPPLLPQLAQDITIPSFLQDQRIIQVNIWMSTDFSRSTLHYDSYHNILVVVKGEKSVTLYPPSDTPLLHARPAFSKSANHSLINLANPSASEMDDLSKITPLVYHVKEGGALFIPEGWWHQVDSASSTIAVNFWFAGFSEEINSNGHMHAYYARNLLQKMIQKEKKDMIRKYATSFSLDIEKLKSGFKGSKDFVDWIATLANQKEIEELLFCMPILDMLVILPDLSSRYPSFWLGALEKASCELLEFLTNSWEDAEGSSKSMGDMKFFYQSLFCHDDGHNDRVTKLQQSILRKTELLRTECGKRMLASFFGVS